MKNIFIIITGLFFFIGNAQEKKVYTFYIELDDYVNAPMFSKNGDKLVYSGKDAEEKLFFSKYELIAFSQSFPASRVARTLNMFTVSTYSSELINDIAKKFPRKYLRMEDLTGLEIVPLNNYPNDYGLTSPIGNLGVPLSLKNFDYINVPSAWDYGYGSQNITIGISDTYVDSTDDDFKYKTSFVPSYTNPYNPPYAISNGSWHGTASASIAAAQGNNGQGLVGVCSECKILVSGLADFNQLLELAIGGARVINMSWRYGYNHRITTHQWIMDELHYCYGVTLVAGAGNENGPTDTYFTYPASYEHVISVSSVNHKNNWNEQVESNATYGQVSWYVADQIRYRIAPNYIGDQSSLTEYQHTYNKDVDICAPGYSSAQYPWYVLNHNIQYGSGTSGAAPHVAGTVGLILSLNDCLGPTVIEDILQLTSKNIESIQGNELFAGKSGSGKLETGDAVKFVNELKKVNGNAIIDGNDFYRFEFNLMNINNKLTISNQKFREACIADFTAKNVIEVLPGTDFYPNDDGLVDLKINNNIDICTAAAEPKSITCPSFDFRESFKKINSQQNESLSSKLYPNPNNGTFEISLGREIKEKLNVEVYDIYGKAVYKGVKEGSLFTVDIPNLSTGMYVVKISSGLYNETIKFIKE